jgi:putative N-acetylmannosamine-6-phosphate epimerase
LTLIQQLTQAVAIPVIAEGRIRTPHQARQALDAGAYGVVVGSAITRPVEITRWFVEALQA